jgi:hypothetical protein
MKSTKVHSNPAHMVFAIAIILAAASFLFTMFIAKNASAAERGKCSLMAKVVKKNPEAPMPKKGGKPIVTFTYSAPRAPVSIATNGEATYHANMIPVMRAVVLPEVSDVSMPKSAKDASEKFVLAVESGE